MMNLPFLYVLFGLALIVFISTLSYIIEWNNWKHLPPSLQSILISKDERKLYTIWMGPWKPLVVISDAEIAVELFEKRGVIYHSRPRLVVLRQIYSGLRSILLLPYGKQYILRRKLLNLVIRPGSLSQFKPRLEAESTKLLMDTLEAPTRWQANTLRYTASNILSITYGRRVDGIDSAVVNSKMAFIEYSTSLAMPGRYLAEAWPLLARVPSFVAPWKSTIERNAQRERDFDESLLSMVRRDIQDREKPTSDAPCLAEILLNMSDNGDEQDKVTKFEISVVPPIMYSAGVETTSATFPIAILGLITHPEVLAIAKAELDLVVGIERLPNLSDNLPYIAALVKEVFRWHPIFAKLPPHATSKNDVYEGYRIPKGTSVTIDVLAINRNPEYFPQPNKFAPSRFLPPSDSRFDGALLGNLPFPSKHGHAGFGWGRRSCPGSALATDLVHLALAKLIWAFDISPIKGESYDEGKLFVPGRLTRKLVPFKVDFEIHSEQHREVLMKEFTEAEIELKKLSTFD